MHINCPPPSETCFHPDSKKDKIWVSIQVEEEMSLEFPYCPNVQIHVSSGCVPKFLRNLEKIIKLECTLFKFTF